MDLPSCNTSDDNASFRYKFEVELSKYEKQHEGSQKKYWTESKIFEVMDHIRQAKVATLEGKRKTPEQYYWVKKYDIVKKAEKEHLIFKRKSSRDPMVRIIPREEYFDIIMQVHEACDHGGRDKMRKQIKLRFYISKKAIETFVSLCPTCKSKKNKSKKAKTATQPNTSQDIKIFNIEGQFEVIDLQSCPDGEYKWLLHYQDNSTKFSNLRPLRTKRSNEVAMELLKIFLTFGPPYVLQSDKEREFTENVIKELSKLWPECKIIPGTTNCSQESQQNFKNILETMMKENNSSNWSFMCYHVQYKINAVHTAIGKSPYKALFGTDPKTNKNYLGSDVSIEIDNIEREPESDEEFEMFLAEGSSYNFNDSDDGCSTDGSSSGSN